MRKIDTPEIYMLNKQYALYSEKNNKHGLFFFNVSKYNEYFIDYY